MPKVRRVMLHRFVANFMRFPAVENFWKSVKIWHGYREFKGGNFFETQYISRLESTKILFIFLPRLSCLQTDNHEHFYRWAILKRKVRQTSTIFGVRSGFVSKKEGKEEYLYSAILADTPLTKRSDMDHTVLPAHYTMSAFPS